MTLELIWTNPSPHPTCGYQALYRRKGDSAYTTINTSGSTSGSTLITIDSIKAPANYEGLIYSDCCSGNLSSGAPFGINSYLPFSLSISSIQAPLSPSIIYSAHIATAYGNPYDTYISGSFMATTTSGTTSHTFNSAVYPAGATSADINIGSASNIGQTITNIQVSFVVPAFDGGGNLQQFDIVNTPPYFKLYWDSSTSGSTWNGNPATLSSFTLDTFQITEVDTFGNNLAGNLNVSWIQDSLYNGGIAPYDSITMEVLDPDTNLIGEIVTNITTIGTRSLTIPLVKGGSPYTLDNITLYTLTVKRSDGSHLTPDITFHTPIPST